MSNTGTWFQRIAQDWLVLTQLTDHSASAVGLVMALQAGPTILLLPYTGAASDRMDRRRLLIATQACLASLAVLLGVLTLLHVITLWGVYLIAFLFGCITAFDAPARHTFVADLVGEGEIANAVALNSASFNAGRLVGPAIAGLVIASAGIGWAFLINGVSFLAVLCSLMFLRRREMHVQARARHEAMQLSTGFRYIWHRSDLKTVLLMTFFVGTFGLNFPIFVSTMAATVFQAGAGRYGMLMSIMALGSLAGALLVARQPAPSILSLMGSAGIFGVGLFLASLCPSIWLFAAALAVVGGSAVAFSTATSSFMQMATDQPMRGRVASIRLAVGLGGTMIGGPTMGWLADQFGPRMSMGVGALSGIAAASVAIRYIAKYRSERGVSGGRGSLFNLQPSDPVTLLENAKADGQASGK